jgi:hypothetical protein
MANTSLNSLLQAFHNAVLEAQRLTEEQHITQLSQYFDWKGGGGGGETRTGIARLLSAQGTPKTLNMQVPSLRAEKAGEQETISVPLLTLIPPTAIKIKSMVVEFEVGLNDLDPESKSESSGAEKGHTEHRALNVDLGGGLFGRKANKAKVRLEFEAGDPAESFQRINDHLIKTIV